MKLLRLLPLFALCTPTFAQPTTQESLHETIAAYATVIQAQENVIIFEYEGSQLVCISDVAADRMRIVSEIVDAEKLPLEQLVICMHANFHSALDARYAVGNGYLYSAFIHPLSPLTTEQIESAIRQVAHLKLTFGTEYSSGELVFPGGADEEEDSTRDI